jgi:hypothetical protein
VFLHHPQGAYKLCQLKLRIIKITKYKCSSIFPYTLSWSVRSGTVKGSKGNSLGLPWHFILQQGHEGPEGEKRYSSTPSLTSALDGGRWSTPHPSRFTPGKDPVPIVQEAGWAPEAVWSGAEISPPPVFDPRTVEPVASRYTVWAISAPRITTGRTRTTGPH